MTMCKICRNAHGNKSFMCREMLLGYRDEFEYFECSSCGCLQIKDVPDDLAKYYPAECYYYQPAKPLREGNDAASGVKRLKINFIRNRLTNHYAKRKSYLGGWLDKRSCLAAEYPAWLRMRGPNLKLNRESSILDVGCATGQHLLDLRACGFTNLTGIDLFIEEDIIYDNGVKIYKRELQTLSGRFDFIMLHHCFEHMPEPLSVLKKLYELLKPGRHLLIRIPIAGSYGWKKYGVNWALLDAPRHLFLHTTKSLKVLAQRAGLELADVLFDSTGFTFWASEQYIKDITLSGEKSYFVSPANSMFSQEEIDAYDAQAVELNKKGEGDCACFYLYRP